MTLPVERELVGETQPPALCLGHGDGRARSGGEQRDRLHRNDTAKRAVPNASYRIPVRGVQAPKRERPEDHVALGIRCVHLAALYPLLASTRGSGGWRNARTGQRRGAVRRLRPVWKDQPRGKRADQEQRGTYTECPPHDAMQRSQLSDCSWDRNHRLRDALGVSLEIPIELRKLLRVVVILQPPLARSTAAANDIAAATAATRFSGAAA